MPTPVAAAYDCRRVGTSPGEIRAIAALFQAVWPTARHLGEAYLRWLYADNPSGPVIGFNAWQGETLAGHYAVIPISALFWGERVKAALSLNTAVHPEHQGKGLFTILAQQTYALAQELEVHHVVGVANANSTPGFVRKLDFRLVRPLDALVLWRSPIRRARNSSRVVAWRRHWDATSLRWRLSNPAARYGTRSRRGCRQILAATGRYATHAILKLDSLRDAPLEAPATLAHGPAAGIFIWMGLSADVEPPSWGAVALPARLRPSPLNLIFRYLSPDARPVDPAAVEFEAIDFDAY